jgi:hypothetical protein
VSAATTVAAAPDVIAGDAGHRRSRSRWLWFGAFGAAAAGGLHIAVAVDHLGVGELTIGFFLLTALAQLGIAAWLLLSAWTSTRPDRRLVTLALFATVALMGLYVVAYTTSLLDGFVVSDGSRAGADSIGGHGEGVHDPGIDPVSGVDLSEGVSSRTPGAAAAMAGEIDRLQTPGVLGPWTIAAETVLVAGLAALQPAAWRRRTTNALIVLGTLAWALWFVGVLQ